MSKPTCRELITRAFEREAGVVLASRVEKVLEWVDSPEGLGLHTDEPGCSLCRIRVELLALLDGLATLFDDGKHNPHGG